MADVSSVAGRAEARAVFSGCAVGRSALRRPAVATAGEADWVARRGVVAYV
ncbi:hypothetical protein [Streptomyces sp. TLI_105]|uniref:hypothetical protein n=1 Tax=Streptomyces sp. TLI_105 TaxID=1881019 RepID=UPI0015A6E77C|nr:hypothetical protein [Streptomyces sp. TLI_105]